MQQWWEALEQLFALLQDAESLGVPREARGRLIAAIGALDSALLNCARADCPIRSTVQDSRAAGGETAAAQGASSTVGPQIEKVEANTAVQTCRTCRWWNHRRGDPATGEGACLLSRTEATAAGAPPRVLANTLARATADEAGVGAVLITRVAYACSQWAPL